MFWPTAKISEIIHKNKNLLVYTAVNMLDKFKFSFIIYFAPECW